LYNDEFYRHNHFLKPYRFRIGISRLRAEILSMPRSIVTWRAMCKTHLLYRKENCLMFQEITSSAIYSISGINAGRLRIEWSSVLKSRRTEGFQHGNDPRVDFFAPMESLNMKISRLTWRMKDQGQSSPRRMMIRTIGSFEMTDWDKSVAQWEPMPNVIVSFWYSDASRSFCCFCEAFTLFVRDEAIRASRFVRGSRRNRSYQ
jgi:hypothetical protein